MNEIKFYKVNQPFGFFSNFSPHPIFIKGRLWPTVEHYFQSSKFESLELVEKIRLMDSPMKAAIEGRNRENKIRSDWEIIKDDLMFEALEAKFLQHPKILKELMLTENSIIIEHTENDNYWGDGKDGKGENKLGILLMRVREKVKKYERNSSVVLPPWIAFPTVNQYDLFWRMGLGEEYLTLWAKCYLEGDKESYRRKFPEPLEWDGIYD